MKAITIYKHKSKDVLICMRLLVISNVVLKMGDNVAGTEHYSDLDFFWKIKPHN